METRPDLYASHRRCCILVRRWVFLTSSSTPPCTTALRTTPTQSSPRSPSRSLALPDGPRPMRMTMLDGSLTDLTNVACSFGQPVSERITSHSGTSARIEHHHRHHEKRRDQHEPSAYTSKKFSSPTLRCYHSRILPSRGAWSAVSELSPS